ncbi:tumor necrosis factor receptor superfamily member 6-like isoform X3 [Onychostoma macrolepis]|uniref:tumor necrosis factor receptor superfamily member 6-like isoform X3 n=1 Tax=Onychostoma macrolepis TaxID=369639 RepID=UPI00272B5488|nr:tumor necrosis factor receptor superfamily member 6-like isoform X3 [Onychostoma macrolepis]
MYAYNLVVFLCCVLLTAGLKEGTRRGACEEGTYQHEGKICCFCQTANMETMVRCSSFHNTVCTCKENHYCDKGDLCKACYPCDTCEQHGVKQPCTKTTNTVCHDPKGPAGIIAAVLVSVILVAGVVVYYLWRKQKFCFKDRKNGGNPEEDLPLKDIDLNPHLSEIVDILGWKMMKRVAQRSDMSITDIEEHELNHRNDVKEQTFALLRAWSQRQGLHGAYPALIKTLRHMKERRTADEIQKIVEKQPKALP